MFLIGRFGWSLLCICIDLRRFTISQWVGKTMEVAGSNIEINGLPYAQVMKNDEGRHAI
jgi:hypothetical protein